MAGFRGADSALRVLRQLPLPPEALAFLDPAAGPLPPPVRGVLYGRERLQQHARNLAQAQPIERRRRRRRPPAPPFFPRLADNLDTLRRVRRYLERAGQAGEALSPAAEALLDHAHLIEAQVPDVRAGLTPADYDALPKLRIAPLAGLPRIYGIAWAFVAHTDAAFDPALLGAFVQAYQEVDELKLAELQALPQLLRVVLVEHLARLAEGVAAAKAARALAHACCDHEDGLSEAQLDLLLDALRQRGIAQPFLAQLSLRIDAAAAAGAPSRWLDWLSDQGADVAALQAQAQAWQAANNVSVTHAVRALQAIAAFDWPGFTRERSPLLQQLRRAAPFRAESALTQAQCAHVAAEFARRLRLPETVIAQRVLDLADAAPADAPARAAGPAWFLLGPGRSALAQSLGRPRRGPLAWLPGSDKAKALAPPKSRRPRALLLAGTALFGTVLLMDACLAGTHLRPWAELLSALLLAIPASAAALAVVLQLMAESVPARRLPRLALAGGLTPAQRTLVVVPCVLTSSAEIAERARALEQHFLANPEAHTQFALLSDWPDAAQHLRAGDALLLDAAREAVAALNRRHPVSEDETAPPRFLLLHRDRSWSASEGAWIGWDRKRGKLAQLLAHLAGAVPAPFIDLDAESRLAPEVAYLVTLDADTVMPPGALRELVAVAAHPLNEPQLHPEHRRVTRGYALLQPRIAFAPVPPPRLTAFGWLQDGDRGPLLPDSADAGFAPGATAARRAAGAPAQIFQNLFGEGVFGGQGLLHVRAAHAALAGRIPEERLFGPDVYESIWARCANLADLAFIEPAPQHPDDAAARRHRRTRGDWQRLPFLRNALRERVGMLNLWKLVDRLRRSLVAPASVALLWWSCALGALPPVRVALLVFLAQAIGPLIAALGALLPRREGIAWRPFLRPGVRELGRAFTAGAWRVALLLDEAILQLDAIGRALWRSGRSRRWLLRWAEPSRAGRPARASQPADPLPRDLAGLAKRHEATIAIALTGLVLGLLQPGAAWGWIIGFGLLWALTPLWLQLASRPLPAPPARQPLPPEDRGYLHDVARDTWRFFERTVTAEDHHLPPASLQVEPQALLARRTSPADIGLYLGAVVCAHRLGFIGTADLIDRLTNTLGTLEQLPRYRGHFPRAIDTATLQVVPPAAVSTADSGLLAAQLWAVAQACRELAFAPAPHDAMEEALRAAVRRLRHVREPALRSLLAEPELQALLTEDLWALWRRAPGVLRDRLDAARALWRELAPADDLPQSLPVNDLLQQLDSLLRDREVDRDRWAALLRQLADRADRLAAAIDFSFLYDPERRLLHTGYRLDLATLEPRRHELLASQARLASYAAIAKGDVPPAHWQALARPFVDVHGAPALRSPAGAMADYLVPGLLLDEPPTGLFAQTSAAAVHAQREDGERLALPWGMSDSAFFAQDTTLAFQHGRFGCTHLALRRMPPDERVVAPYASALAAMVAPAEAVANLRRLERLGARDAYGFIDALDFTRNRLGNAADESRPQRVSVFMAAHQGMTLLALANLLHGQPLREWFSRAPLPRSHAALLQEPMPREIVYPPGRSPWRDKPHDAHAVPVVRSVDLASPLRGPLPTQWLGNGRYGVALDARGAGSSQWRGIAISRWRDDPLRHGGGTWLMMRRGEEVEFHSLTQAPHPHPGARYLARFHPDRVEHEARAADWATQVDTWVGDDDIELREVRVHNLGDTDAEFELLTCVEVALAPQREDEAHPAAAKRLVRAHLGDARCLVLQRPAAGREPAGDGVWMAHFLAASEVEPTALRITCDRARLLPRLGSLAQLRPIGTPPTRSGEPLPTGHDPVASLAVRLVVPAQAQRRLVFATAAAADADTLQAMIDKYRHEAHLQRARLMAATLARIRQRELRVEAIDVAAIQDLATLMHGHHDRRRPLPTGPLDRRALWRFGLSGEQPIVLLRVSTLQGLPVARALLAAQRLWSLAGLHTELVIVNGEPAAAEGALQAQIEAQRTSLGRSEAVGVRLLRHDDLSTAELAALQTLARIDLLADGRPLARLLAQALAAERPPSRAVRAAARGIGAGTAPERRLRAAIVVAPRPDDLASGSFSDDGREYRIAIDGGRVTPRPWANVLANPRFGCVVTEAGGGFTWARDSALHRLTPWSNDPLLDPAGEHFLVQDALTQDTWGLLPTLERNGAAGYRVTHAPGESRFEHERNALEVEVRLAVHPEAPAKLLQVRLHNHGSAPRVLRLIGMVEWVLGRTRADRMTLATEFVPEAQAVIARQLERSQGFGEATAFLMLAGLAPQQWTCARAEFFDAQGRLAVPRAFAGEAGLGLDPCGALECTQVVAPGGELHFAWVIGHGDSRDEAIALAQRLRTPEAANAALNAASAGWAERLGALQVHTPDPLFDALVNHWLPYQAVACGLWSRAGVYEADGALGYREGLQQALALLHLDPGAARAQIVEQAGRQYVEGDVQHRWHPATGAGLRTRCGDDLLWLPHALRQYLDATGDEALLDETAPFLEGPLVPEGAAELQDTPTPSDTRAPLYEHVARAIDHACRFGVHGLPLTGGGDWCSALDGPSLRGRSESVWLGWLLLRVLQAWVPIAQQRGDAARSATWATQARALEQALAHHGWDGRWFRRAYFDDGQPIGSHLNDEAQIELSVQAWSVFALPPGDARARGAMDEADARLVDRRLGALRLLYPPLQHEAHALGAIQALAPGVRDNGGQVSLAVAWAAQAQARLGRAAQAWAYFSFASPAHRAHDPSAQRRYRLEPYAVADSLCTLGAAEGQGGWSWTTPAAAAELYRTAVESLLGLTRHGCRLSFAPCLPPHWTQARLSLRIGDRQIEVLLQAADAPSPAPSQDAPVLQVAAGEWLVLDALPARCTLCVRVAPPTEPADRPGAQAALPA